MARPERHSQDFHTQQRATIGEGVNISRPGETIENEVGGMTMAYADAIAFGEEPVMIRIERSREKNPPTTVPCWVNGKGAEVFKDGKWWALGFLPIGMEIITRRKYVEVLAAAKMDSVDTRPPTPSDIMEGRNVQNEIDVSTSSLYPFSVIQDPSPRGHEWLTNLMYTRV